MAYSASARGYFERAKECLTQDERKFLFYAAFELRCAVEARMQDYLESWKHVSKKQRQGWEIKKLGAATDRAFRIGDRIMRWKVEDETSGRIVAVLYYTPVTKKLQKDAARLGDYLHAPKKYHPEEDGWWGDFRKLLDEIVVQLRIALTGTLLGPALMRGNNIDMNTELPPGTEMERLFRKGETVRVHVDYLDHLPQPLDKEAIVGLPEEPK